jgi:hypothetical protein
MKVKEGDVLVCKCKDCDVELTVTKACKSEVCGTRCDVKAMCCDEPMKLKGMMDKDRYLFLCSELEAGREAFVSHPSSEEEGGVVRCEKDHLIVETVEGKERCWDFRECEIVSARSKGEWPWR